MKRTGRVLAVLGSVGFLAACAVADAGSRAELGQSRGALLNLNELPVVPEGAFAIEDTDLGGYRSYGADMQTVVTRFDNPLFGWYGRTLVQKDHPPDEFPEEHFVRLNPFGITNTYANFETVAENGDGPALDRQFIAAVNDYSILSYVRRGAGANPDTPGFFTSRGLRIGYRPLTVYASARGRMNQIMARSVPLQIKLDPRVYLVPVEVWVFRSADHPGEVQRRQYQAMLWDQQQETTVAIQSEPNIGNVKTRHTLATRLDGGRVDTWMDPGLDQTGAERVYTVNSLYSPDSALASCGVQFRMIQYREVLGKARMAYPKRAVSGAEETDSTYPSGALDDAPCYERKRFIEDSGEHDRDNVLTVAFSDREGLDNSTEASRAIPGLICTSMNPGVVAPAVLAHEIGHAAGLADPSQPSGPTATVRLMVAGGGLLPPTPAECGAIRRWARPKAIRAELGGTVLEPAPVGDWSWP